MKFSSLIAGVMNWGVWDKNLDTNTMEKLIHTFINQDITSFDHADIYGGYTTEESFGKAFKNSGIQRGNVQFISKCGIKYLSKKRDYSIKHYDYSEEYILWSVEESLKNLQNFFRNKVCQQKNKQVGFAQLAYCQKTLEIETEKNEQNESIFITH